MGFCAGAGLGAATGAASLITPAATPLSRTMPCLTAVAAGGGALSALAITVRGTVVSAFDVADAAGVLPRVCPTSAGVLLRKTHIEPTIATNAATPTPRQICGATGARSGLVPHHRHSPADSG
jgi:hypothetical protein